MSQSSSEVLEVTATGEERIVEEFPEDSNVDINVVNVRLRDFKSIAVYTKLDLIQEPTHTTRYLDATHSDKLKKRLREIEYTPSCGMLSVALPSSSSHLAPSISIGSTIDFSTVLIDGRHRLRAMQALQKEDSSWIDKTKKLEVRLYLPNEGVPLDNFAVIALGQQLNKTTELNLFMDLRARMHSAISSIITLSERENVPITNLPIKKTAQNLHGSNSCGNLKPRTYRRYTALGLRLA